MFKILGYIYSILHNKQKKIFWYLLFLSFIAMLFETLSIVSVMSLLNIFSDIDKSIFFTELNFFLNFEKDVLVLIFIALVSFIFLIKTVFLIYYTKVKTLFIENVKVEQSNNLFAYYLNQPFFFHINSNSSILIRNLNEAQHLGFIVRVCIEFLLDVLILIGLLTFLINLNPKITFGFILVFLFFSSIFYLFINKRAVKWGAIRQNSAGIKLKKIQQSFASIRDIKILNKEIYFSESFSKTNQEEGRSNYKNTFFSSMPKILFEFILILLILITFIYIYFKKMDIVFLLPMISAYAFAAYRLVPSTIRILNANQSVKYWFSIVKPYIEKSRNFVFKEIDSIKDKKLSKRDYENFHLLKNKDLNIKNVSFKFENSTDLILDKINLKFNQNDFIGIYGESGSGKTTFINLLLGLYKPDEGEMFFGGKNIFNNLKSWRKLLSFIPQNIYILDDTIIKNVAFGHDSENINIEKAKDALKKANAYEFVYSLKNNLSTNCGELGEFLSGGQRQRIAIARAFYNNSKIFIFDEFTNFLDEEKEDEIMREISRMKNKTRIIISHNKKILDYCDKIYEIKNKSLVIVK